MRLFIFAALVPIIAAPAFAQSGLQGKVVGCVRRLRRPRSVLVFRCRGAWAQTEWRSGVRGGIAEALCTDLRRSRRRWRRMMRGNPDHVSLAVAAVSEGAGGKLRLTMENGQVWRQVDTAATAQCRSGAVDGGNKEGGHRQFHAHDPE